MYWFVRQHRTSNAFEDQWQWYCLIVHIIHILLAVHCKYVSIFPIISETQLSVEIVNFTYDTYI